MTPSHLASPTTAAPALRADKARGTRTRGWVALAAAALVVVAVPLPTSVVPSTQRTIRLEVRNFEYSPSILRVNPGDIVTLEIVAADVVRGVYLDGYDLSVSADPGQTARLTFTADRPGSFRIRCSVTCEPLHPFMIGILRVGSDPLLWRGFGLAFLAAVAGLRAVWR